MGRVRSKVVKRTSRLLINKWYPLFNLDFHHNKRMCDEKALCPSKRIRNKIAGYITVLMKRLRRSQVRGISLKLQELEREQKENYLPEISALDKDIVEVDFDTYEMLKEMGMTNIPGLQRILD